MMAVADDMPTTALRGSDREDLPLADYILRKTQFLYALVLLTAFISCAAWYSVVNAKKQEDLVQPTVKGPGGKPLPITKKKRSRDGARKIGPGFGRTAKNVFRSLAAIVFLCYVGSASFMFYHAFWYEDPYRWSKEGLPWAGEWSVVGDPSTHLDNAIVSRADPICLGSHCWRTLLPPLYPHLALRLAQRAQYRPLHCLDSRLYRRNHPLLHDRSCSRRLPLLPISSK
jgi:hypothetical protein